jgi:hypothetical protein
MITELKVLHSALIEIVRISHISSSRPLQDSKVSQIPARPAPPAFTATFFFCVSKIVLSEAEAERRDATVMRLLNSR